jgi:hypothetical protein
MEKTEHTGCALRYTPGSGFTICEPAPDMTDWRVIVYGTVPFTDNSEGSDTFGQTYSEQDLIIAKGRTLEEAQANARRVTAVWNACQYIPTEALESGIIAELLCRLRSLTRKVTRMLDGDLGDEEKALLDACYDTIAKTEAEGRASCR